MPKKILLLGVSGFVGSSIRSACLEPALSAKYEWNLVRSKDAEESDTVSSIWHTWDVTTECSLRPEFDIILHAATPASASLNLENPNGPEFIAETLHDWCKEQNIQANYCDPGSPWQNGRIESFNSRVRDELLPREVFDSM